MSEQQKISLELTIKIWGGVIVMLLSLSVFVYMSGLSAQREFNREALQFMSKQYVTNGVIFDLIRDVHPDADNKTIQYLNRYESINTRGGKLK